jgi:arsenate reductase
MVGSAPLLRISARVLREVPHSGLWRQLIAAMAIPVRALLRQNVEPYDALGLAEDRFTDGVSR